MPEPSTPPEDFVYYGEKLYPHLQILTVAELLEGKTMDAPPLSARRA